MAANSSNRAKTTKTNKSNSNRRNYKGQGAKNKSKGDLSSFHDEIILIITLVISLLLILSGFHLSGVVGNAINVATFGLFGFFAYLLPYFLFFGVAFRIANRGNKIATRKLISMICLSIVLISFMQMLYDETSALKLMEYFNQSAESKLGGGLVGAIICKLLTPLFGEIGTYIILIALMIILFMLITEKLFFASLSKNGTKTIAYMKEKRKAYLEQREAEYEEMELEEPAPPKRKAKTFTFKKADQENTTTNNKEPDESFAAANAGMNQDISNGLAMEEINSTIMDIPIQRGTEMNENIAESEDDKPVYEKELDNKFGRGKAYDIKELANKVMNMDSVIDESLDSEKEENIVPEIVSAFTESETVPGKVKDADAGEFISPVVRTAAVLKKDYIFPPIDLLSKPAGAAKGITDVELKETAMKLQSTLESFGVKVTITNVSCGPAVTRYELQPEQGVKVSKITGLADDIKLNLAAADIRIEAPIPGKAAVGIEVPNKTNSAVMLRELIESNDFKKHSSDIAFAVGKDIGGQTVVTDIARMPHLLIAGATGSGKSVCINTLIMSILYKADPADVKLIMVDPKVVELSVYNGIPHLLIPVVTDPKKASAALNWAVMEMTERYNKFAEIGVRDIKGYNEKIKTVEEYQDERYQKMPQIVIIVDELADLMMVAPGEVEDAICRLAQMARAAGLHLIIATQRPSVNVITGLIKANVPSRIAFSVSSAIDSRTIIDGAGAEKLLGKGDMLFFPSGYPKPVRIQGAFVSDKEVGAVVKFLAKQNSEPQYSEDIANQITSTAVSGSAGNSPASDRDEYFIEAGKFIIEKDKASIGMLQRVYKIGFNRAARIMDQLCEAGVVGPEEGTKPRKVLMSLEEFEQYIEEYV
ncbi:S-DNA-T family DNA segregation ATPase FtsK/SpoIIIE [Mobilisporobacter senegalensis]|uniref:S-DNA-T family DNA segregation ATPase FtsK/SpoIIIE n=1 Tax=Mobilisporobacter senegalensis TaxID=1329262 RepID=A0A3N1X5P6_9FIRM|nr:DNA translocase FtsK [Mobilisporobacter senegalensis]ROR22106.1 S-DNA-T family DNA segregation ATPase FtsK/SpoIIIE [Mobilisporobacter senegalensis]